MRVREEKMRPDAKLYTIKHLVEQLALLEDHLKEFASGMEAAFCLDCGLKHIVSLSGYAQECIGFGCAPARVITELKKWADDLTFRLKDLDREDAKKAMDKARYFRKNLQGELLKKPSGVSRRKLKN